MSDFKKNRNLIWELSKNDFKKSRFIHHDICPYDELQSKDQQNDKNIIETLPMVINYMKEHHLLHHHLDKLDKVPF